MRNHFGKCAICRREANLTFEHIPPKSAFNSFPSKIVTGDKLIIDGDRMPWDTSGLPYSNQQSGMGKYTLCADCNNNTGSWYGNAYNDMAHVVHNIINRDIPETITAIKVPEVYPLRFIKQIFSMFCSLNNFDDERIDILRRFVLNRNDVGLDKSKYKLCMYLTRSTITKHASLSVLLRQCNSGFAHIALSEITAYPLGFILYFDPIENWEYEGIDITGFADYDYNFKGRIEMPLCIKEMNDFLPETFRSKEEICNCIEVNRAYEKDIIE